MANEREIEIFEEFLDIINNLYTERPNDGVIQAVLIAANMDVQRATYLFQQLREAKLRLTKLDDIELQKYTVAKEVADSVQFKILGKDFDGRIVVWAPAGKFDFRKLIQNNKKVDLFRHIFKVFEGLAFEFLGDRTKSASTIKAVALLDLQGLSFGKISHYETIQMSLELAKLAELLTPLCHRVYVVNAPKILQYIISLVKPILSKTSMEKLVILGSDQSSWLEGLKGKIPIDLIPSNYGGLGPSILY